MEAFEARINCDQDVERFRDTLEQSWEPGFVADIFTIDGQVISAVLIVISRTSLILDRWDCLTGTPAGDPFTLNLRTVSEIVVH